MHPSNAISPANSSYLTVRRCAAWTILFAAQFRMPK
jgi:hypothetical protein